MRQNRNIGNLFFQLLWLPFILLAFSCAQPLVTSNSAVLLGVDGQIPEDSRYVGIIHPYKEQLDKEMGKVIARGAKELKKNKGESPLGNLVADLQWAYCEEKFGRKVDISVINNGGLRNSLPGGDITLGNIFELAPFENFIYLLELTASDVENLAGYAVKAKNLGMAGLYVAGTEDILSEFRVGGKAVEEGKTYVLAINDYLANGGDYMDFLIPLPRIVESDVLLRDMLVDQMKKWTAAGKAIDAEIEGRQQFD